jgi:2-C-methyl-D-erythritol 4-phosphate cytidylyltransferase/2-C-methyl-D-erythritol 2,4-cyclodiphosphate synthase
MHTIAIIVSAGSGKRFQAKIPKQYINIAGKPILYYTVSAFNKSACVDGIILVCSKERIDYCRRLIRKYNLKKVFSVVEGGKERSNSVYNGLQEVPPGAKIILVHDGVRPLVSELLIENTILAAKKYGSAVAGIPPKNTIKEVSNDLLIKKTIARNALIEVQTPQTFKYEILKTCYDKFKNRLDKVTDDSSLVEMAGYKVKIVNGDYNNIKITTKEDIGFLKNILGKDKNAIKGIAKIGVGYDIHRLEKNRRLVLGGVSIPSKYGLVGHSDADVLLHAITDAMLGAIGERDIGWHFSNRDPKYRGMDSSYFLLVADRLVKKNRYKVRNIDSIIVAQEPKLQPYYIGMVKNISGWLGLDKNAVTVKFTTPEEVGPLGDKKAIAGMAVVGLERE